MATALATGGAGEAHAYTKVGRATIPTVVADQVMEELEAQREQWAKLWCRSGHRQKLYEKLGMMRGIAKKTPRRPITPHQAQQAIKRIAIKKNRARSRCSMPNIAEKFEGARA